MQYVSHETLELSVNIMNVEKQTGLRTKKTIGCVDKLTLDSLLSRVLFRFFYIEDGAIRPELTTLGV